MILIIIAGIVVLLLVFYLTNRVSKSKWISNVSQKKRPAAYAIAFLTMAAFFLIFSLTMSVSDAVYIFLHVLVFYVIYGILIRIVRLIFKKNGSEYTQGRLAICTSVIWLLVSWILVHNVWQKDYSISTPKEVSLRVAYISDCRLGHSIDAKGFERRLNKIKAAEPDLLIISGYLAGYHTSKEDMIKYCEALGRMDLPYGVFITQKQHDTYYRDGSCSFKLDDMNEVLEQNGVKVLEDDHILIDDRFYIAGRTSQHRRSKTSIPELLEGLDTDKYIIVVSNESYKPEHDSESAANLVLSGSDYSGFPFPLNIWLRKSDHYRISSLENVNGTDFIVTSGLSVGVAGFRNDAKSEYVIVNINKAE